MQQRATGQTQTALLHSSHVACWHLLNHWVKQYPGQDSWGPLSHLAPRWGPGNPVLDTVIMSLNLSFFFSFAESVKTNIVKALCTLLAVSQAYSQRSLWGLPFVSDLISQCWCCFYIIIKVLVQDQHCNWPVKLKLVGRPVDVMSPFLQIWFFLPSSRDDFQLALGRFAA